jgi:arabinofuranosyltransferase
MAREPAESGVVDPGGSTLDSNSRSLSRFDWAAVLGLVGIVFVGYRHYVQLRRGPYEDAAMLLRYAVNLANGHGFVFNVSGPHVDGATDFLSTVLLGGLIRFGLSAADALRSLDLVTHIATVLGVYLVGRFVHRAPVIVSAVPALFLAYGPALTHAAAYFATPVFGFFVALTIAASYICRQRPTDGKLVAAFAVSALLMSLTRPEGVVLTGLILIAVVWWVNRYETVMLLLRFSAIFVTGGLVYFVWHWLYFGYPLPNPYYEKGGGTLHTSGLSDSIHVVWSAAWPLLLLMAIGLLVRRSRRDALFILVPVVGFTAVWVLLSSETNFAGRFQYPVLVMLAMGTAPVAIQLFGGVKKRRALEVAASVTLLLLLLLIDVRDNRAFAAGFSQTRLPSTTTIDIPVARRLKQFGPSARMAVTEAGALPFYSGWQALDTWGLNDATIAHRGVLRGADLDAFQPDVIMFYASFSPIDVTPTADPEAHAWTHLTLTMNSYAVSHRYELAAAYGSLHACRYFYVRTDWQRSSEVVAAIRDAGARIRIPDLRQQ